MAFLRARSARLLALSLAAAFGAGGCAWTLESLEDGSPILPAQYEVVRVEEDRLGEVLAALGPPRTLLVTKDAEILEWSFDRYAGTHLSLSVLFPGLGLLFPINPLDGAFRSLADATIDVSDAERKMRERDPASLALPVAMRAAVGQVPGDFQSEEVLNLRNRRIRTSVLRIVLDRASGRVREKSFRDDAGTGRTWLRSTLLQE